MEAKAAQQKRISIKNAENTIKIWMPISFRSDVRLDTELEILRGLKWIAWLGSIIGAFNKNILPDFPQYKSEGSKR